MNTKCPKCGSIGARVVKDLRLPLQCNSCGWRYDKPDSGGVPLAMEIDETLRHAAGTITPEAKTLLEMARREAIATEIRNRMFHFYAQTDGTMRFPNSAEGDILKLVHEYLAIAPPIPKPEFRAGPDPSYGAPALTGNQRTRGVEQTDGSKPSAGQSASYPCVWIDPRKPQA